MFPKGNIAQHMNTIWLTRCLPDFIVKHHVQHLERNALPPWSVHTTYFLLLIIQVDECRGLISLVFGRHNPTLTHRCKDDSE